jgi:sec-independent protein translocase protein TatC
MCLIFGFVFELPVVSFVLSKMGIIDYRFLIRYFRHAIVIIFIVSALLTPPDVLSLILMSLPLSMFYGISIFISYLAWRKANNLHFSKTPEIVEIE